MLDQRYRAVLSSFVAPAPAAPSHWLHSGSSSGGTSADGTSTATSAALAALTHERRLRKSSLSRDAPDFLPLFAFSRGIKLELRGPKTHLPRDAQFLSFVLTNELGQLTYGFCLTFEDALRTELAAKVLAMRAVTPGRPLGGVGGGGAGAGASLGRVCVCRAFVMHMCCVPAAECLPNVVLAPTRNQVRSRRYWSLVVPCASSPSGPSRGSSEGACPHAGLLITAPAASTCAL